jgi:SPP1 gp7 family putative phage head morphogenesis protein
LRDTIGLTNQQTGWVENFRQRQITDRMNAGRTFDQAVAESEKATNRYHDRIHKYRTETIARTEILRASNEGRREAWEQGVQDGFIGADWVKIWSTEFDDRTCEECAPLDGETAPVLGDFPWGDPPLHPNCRCTLLLDEPQGEDFSALSDDELEELINDLIDETTEDPQSTSEDDPYDSYRGSHEAPGRDYGAPMHDLTSMYPEDVYGPDGARYYGSGGDTRRMEEEMIRLFREVRDNPDAKVTIYRSMPSSVEDANINAGDWVTPSRAYAEYHGEGPLKGDYQIVAIEVKASELFTEANSLMEWGYDPLPVD